MIMYYRYSRKDVQLNVMFYSDFGKVKITFILTTIEVQEHLIQFKYT